MTLINACLPDLKKKSKEEIQNEKLIKLMDQTGYPLMQMNGQRVFGPPPYWAGPKPKRGSEIFVGKLPRYIFEDELVPLFSSVGPIYQLRLMMDFSGSTRGYAFVTYLGPEYANSAVQNLNDYEIRPRRHIGVYKSMDNCRLFVGRLPLDKTRDEIWHKLEECVDGIENVIMYPAYESQSNNLNRGYGFVEFCDHKSAAIARRQLGSGVVFWGSVVSADWADPVPDVDPAIMERVTKLYMRNLNINLTNSALHLELLKYIPSYMIRKVHKVTDYAFVHFDRRGEAESALNVLQGALIAGRPIEVSWARPRMYSKAVRLSAPAQNFCTSVPPRMRRVIWEHKKQYEESKRPQSGTSSSTYSDFSGSPGSSSLGSFNMNINEPVVNIVNLNMMPHSSLPDVLPDFFKTLRL